MSFGNYDTDGLIRTTEIGGKRYKRRCKLTNYDKLSQADKTLYDLLTSKKVIRLYKRDVLYHTCNDPKIPSDKKQVYFSQLRKPGITYGPYKYAFILEKDVSVYHWDWISYAYEMGYNEREAYPDCEECGNKLTDAEYDEGKCSKCGYALELMWADDFRDSNYKSAARQAIFKGDDAFLRFGLDGHWSEDMDDSEVFLANPSCVGRWLTVDEYDKISKEESEDDSDNDSTEESEDSDIQSLSQMIMIKIR